MEEPLRRIQFNVPAGTLYARAAGPEDGPVLILLHGFPEFWYGWRKQIPGLASAGYRVVALDQRGYNESVKPASVSDYAMSTLSADVLAVADALGSERFLLAGHDWGGIIAWEIAMHNPERIRRMAILNAPHPAAGRRFMTTRLKQMLRSWYVLLFQVPVLPERVFSARHFEAGLASMTLSSVPGVFSAEDLREYQRAWSQPGAVTGMINWYRALARYSRSSDFSPRDVRVPTRILWGMRDKFLSPELARESLAYCAAGELVEFDNATHWLLHEEPEPITANLIDWFGGAI
jgi:pimeloyl-ACP methyl ester carboxylesterase